MINHHCDKDGTTVMTLIPDTPVLCVIHADFKVKSKHLTGQAEVTD